MNGDVSRYRPFPAALWQAVIIVLLGAVTGLAFNGARDEGIPLVGSVRVVKFDQPVAAAPARQTAEVPPAVSGADPVAPVETPGDVDDGGEPVPAATTPAARETPDVPPPVEEPQSGGSGGVEVFSALPVAESAEEDDHGPKALDLAQALELFEQGEAVFVDARMPDEFAAGHIPGAMNLPYDELESHLDVLNYLPDGGLVITYCDGSECELSLELADELTAMGFGQVRVFFGGWEQWFEAGHPTEEGEATLPY